MELLSFEAFEIRLQRELNKKYPDKWEVVNNITKVNEERTGIAIECSENAKVIVYPKELYEAYEAEESMDVVLGIIQGAIMNREVEFCLEILSDWDKVKKYIKPFIMNYDKNIKFIKERHLVCERRLNLAYGCYVDFEEKMPNCNAGTYVVKGMLEHWGISENDLYEVAEQNSQFEVVPMRAVIEQYFRSENTDESVQVGDEMLVLSNEIRYRGAAGMFDMNLLKKVADVLECNFFILPSSIHEVILVKDDESVSAIELRMMVEEVNHTQVKIEEYLADNVYYFDREAIEILMVA